MGNFNESVAGTTDTTSINRIITLINERKMLLPALQRKFVWTDEQITTLFDSIMQDYPIGTLIFWDLETEVARRNDYTFYEFIREFSERYDDAGYFNPRMARPLPTYTEPNKLYAEPNLYIVLDGQQRITAIYIALQGSITRKRPYKKEYITRELYFNLRTNLYNNNISANTSSDIEEAPTSQKAFVFLSNEELREQQNIDYNNNNDKAEWFKVKDILNYRTVPEVAKYLRTKGLEIEQVIYDNIVRLMNKVHNERIFKEPLNNY